MSVLKEYSPLPELEREGKHGVAVTGRPIWHGHAGLVAGHQSAEAEQKESNDGRQHRESVHPRLAGGFGVGIHPWTGVYLISNVKFTVTSLSATSTDCVCAPSLR